MAKFDSYYDCLAKIKELNPNLPFSKRQQLASELWKNQKEETTDKVTADGVSKSALDVFAKKIRYKCATINELQSLLNNEGMKNYKIHKEGKEGANSKVYIELITGERLPETGYFIVYGG